MNKLYTPEEVAEMFGIKKETVKAMARNGELTGITIGGNNAWRFQQSDIDTYITNQRMKSLAPKEPVLSIAEEVKEVKPLLELKAKKPLKKVAKKPVPAPISEEVKEEVLGIPLFDKDKQEATGEVIPLASDEEILQLKKEGHTVKDMVDLLNEKGRLTKTGKPFNFENLKSRLATIRKGAK